MCRMFAMFSQGKSSQNILKAAILSLKKAAEDDPYLKNIPRTHPHGWGIVAYNLSEDAHSLIYRSRTPIYEDKIADFIVQSSVFNDNFFAVAHVRKAPPNSPLKLTYVHPFEEIIDENMTLYLVHNGVTSRRFLTEEFNVTYNELSDTQIMLKIIGREVRNGKDLKYVLRDFDNRLLERVKSGDIKAFSAVQLIIAEVKNKNAKLYAQSLINTYRYTNTQESERKLRYYALYVVKMRYNDSVAIGIMSSSVLHYIKNDFEKLIFDITEVKNGELVEIEYNVENLLNNVKIEKIVNI
ncbi:MAG: class II glutamine amidotransferase [Candidatus Asgardarchaeia archaeon]